MKLVAESGLWSAAPTPLVAVLEVSGAVLSWTVDEPPEDVRIAFTDVSRADWLWRVVGESGHLALAASAAHDLTGVDVVPGSLDTLRRLALGHWLRRWWPASRRDGIAGLDRALLDVEVALLTAGAQAFFTDETLDSDVADLLAPHGRALSEHVAGGDPRIVALVRAGAGLADDVGADGPGWSEVHAALDDSDTVLEIPGGRRDDYALAAGAGAGPRRPATIAAAVASVNWTAVPPAIFDGAENTVEWSVQAAGTAAVAVVTVAVIGPDAATGVPVQLRSGAVGGSGALDAGGRATLPLVDAQQHPLTESAAWNHDWSATSLIVGAETTESLETRERIRRWARARLSRPSDDAFLAEILAAESDY